MCVCVLASSELADSLSRMGADIKQRIIDSVRTTWQTLNNFALAHRTAAAPPGDKSIEEEVDNALHEMADEHHRDIDTECMIVSVGRGSAGGSGTVYNINVHVDYVLHVDVLFANVKLTSKVLHKMHIKINVYFMQDF